MFKPRILLLNTYPIRNAQHGGQKRSAAIVKAYQDQGWDVRYVAVYFPGFYPVAGQYDIPVGASSQKLIQGSPYTGDIICGNAIYEDPKVKQKIVKLIQSFQPTIIQCEQVFPYFGLKRLLTELSISPKLVFSSQNIEYSMKAEILEGVGVAKTDAAAVAAEILPVEQDLAQVSDLVVAVSDSDAEELEKMGAKRVVLAANGIARVKASDKAKTYWKKHFADKGIKHTAAFIGSAHPPNWFGFLTMVGDKVGFVSATNRLLLAGSIGDYFQNTFQGQTIEEVTFWRRVIATGRIDDDSLAGLIEAIDVIMLPITEGGGSNLKTAEAILSGRKIVATTYAFRAFEQFMDLPNVYITDDPTEFRHKLVLAMESPAIPLTATQERDAEAVLWEHQLKGMVAAVAAL
jgi:hypothetical protein